MILPHPQVMTEGLALGSLYGMAASGMQLILGSTGKVHMAGGHILILGALLVAHVAEKSMIPLANLVLGVGLASAFLAHMAHPRGLWRRVMVEGGERMFLLLTLGTALVLEALGQWAWPLPATASAHGGAMVSLGGISLARPKVLAVAASIALALSLWAFLRLSMVGKALRAWEAGLGEIRLVGVDPYGLGRWVSALGLGIVGLSGGLVGATQVVSAQEGMGWCVRALCIAVLGGELRPLKTLALGWGLGLGEAWVSHALEPGWHPALVPALLPLLLWLRARRGAWGLGA